MKPVAATIDGLTTAIIDLVNLAKKTATVVLNAVPPRGSSASEASEAIATYGVAVAPIQVGQRAAFVHSLIARDKTVVRHHRAKPGKLYAKAESAIR